MQIETGWLVASEVFQRHLCMPRGFFRLAT